MYKTSGTCVLFNLFLRLLEIPPVASKLVCAYSLSLGVCVYCGEAAEEALRMGSLAIVFDPHLSDVPRVLDSQLSLVVSAKASHLWWWWSGWRW